MVGGGGLSSSPVWLRYVDDFSREEVGGLFDTEAPPILAPKCVLPRSPLLLLLMLLCRWEDCETPERKSKIFRMIITPSNINIFPLP